MYSILLGSCYIKNYFTLTSDRILLISSRSTFIRNLAHQFIYFFVYQSAHFNYNFQPNLKTFLWFYRILQLKFVANLSEVHELQQNRDYYFLCIDSIPRRYCIDKREEYTLYNKLSREIREIVRFSFLDIHLVWFGLVWLSWVGLGSCWVGLDWI